MSHVKSGGAVAQTKNMVGKRLGVKKYSGNLVKNGTIIVRQNGSVYHPGKNCKMSRDFSIYSLIDGYVSFRKMSGNKRGKYFIDVLMNKTIEVKSNNLTVSNNNEKKVKKEKVEVPSKKSEKIETKKEVSTKKVINPKTQKKSKKVVTNKVVKKISIKK